MKAIWNNQIIAESDHTEIVEGNHYFPPESVNMAYFKKSGNHYQCPWKGLADYYDLVVDGQVNPDAAWIYPEPSKLAQAIKGHVAFWKGVEVVK